MSAFTVECYLDLARVEPETAYKFADWNDVITDQRNEKQAQEPDFLCKSDWDSGDPICS
jgi:hypothetical protein